MKGSFASARPDFRVLKPENPVTGRSLISLSLFSANPGSGGGFPLGKSLVPPSM